MTREQESDSTLSPERGEGGIETPSPQRLEGRQYISVHCMVGMYHNR